MTALIASLSALAVVGLAPAARAGDWIEVSCVNPNGSAAPSQGWVGSAAGNPPPGSDAVTACGPGQPMSAHLLGAFAAAPVGSIESLTYTPPAGSTLVGGSVNVNMFSDAVDPNATGVSATELYSPTNTSLSDRLLTCVPFLVSCSPGSATPDDYSGTVAIPAGRGGAVIADATCVGTQPCMQGGHGNDWAETQIVWGNLLLSASDSPTGTDFSGSALQSRARGTAHVVFSASVPSGPGIYAVAAAVDGRVVFDGQPNSNSGQCVPVGTDPSSGALMFDFAQPCLTSETVDVPVPTAGLPDGSHALALSVIDAAQNSSTVLDSTIHTFNPQITPLPKRGLKTRFVISWRWAGRVTHLRSITVRRLPRHGRLAVSCHGRRCPRLKVHAVGARHASRLLKGLGRRRFHAGDRVRLTVTAPHHRPERILLKVRRGAQPTARLLSGHHHHKRHKHR